MQPLPDKPLTVDTTAWAREDRDEMSTYFDTSFLLKLYVYEAESAIALGVFSTQADLFINSLTDVEVASSLFRRLSV